MGCSEASRTESSAYSSLTSRPVTPSSLSSEVKMALQRALASVSVRSVLRTDRSLSMTSLRSWLWFGMCKTWMWRM